MEWSPDNNKSDVRATGGKCRVENVNGLGVFHGSQIRHVDAGDDVALLQPRQRCRLAESHGRNRQPAECVRVTLRKAVTLDDNIRPLYLHAT